MAVVAALLAALAALVPAAAAQARSAGDTRVFSKVPSPGQPAGIALDGRRVLVSTAGVSQTTLDPRLFVFDLATHGLAASHAIPMDHDPSMQMGQHPLMTNFGVAVDAARRAYVVDMNGRVVRIDPVTGRRETYATFPISQGGVDSMPFDIAFDDAGDAYVTDQNLPTIWRVPPGGGTAQPWFADPRLAGYLFGASGIRIDPTGRWIYFSVGTSRYPATNDAGLIYRLPLTANPTGGQLDEVYRYPAGVQALGIAFGASGRLYVALAGPDQVSVLRPAAGGKLAEEARFPSAEQNRGRDVPYRDPLGVALDGCGSLLVTNSTAVSAPGDAADWAVLDAWVGDTPARLARPALPGAAPVPAPETSCAAGAAKAPHPARHLHRARTGHRRRA
jgi:sugar lactone lactonase YvrE